MTRRLLLPQITEIGVGALSNIPNMLVHFNIRKAFVLVDHSLPGEIISQVSKITEKFRSNEIFKGPVGEPTTDLADSFATIARHNNSDGVVAIGGGSIMDLGKAVSVLASHPEGAATYQGMNLIIGSGLPVICVPTTAGSGAEATKSAVLTNLATETKRGINSLGVLPNAVIIDPQLLISLPKKPRIAALLDATTHALESYIGRSSWELSELTSLAAFSSLGEHLRFQGDNLNLELAQKALIGAYLAGASICNSETGAVHALAYPLTEYHEVPHAYAIGTLLPEILRFQHLACFNKLEAASFEMGFESFELFLNRVENLRLEIESLNQVQSILANKSYLDRIVDRSMTLKGALENSPYQWNESDVRKVFEQIRDLEIR